MIPIVILAGGKSSRFDFQDKGLIKINAKSAISYVIDVAKHITNNIYIVSSNPEYDHFAYPRIEDIYRESGPMGGIHAALSKITSQKYLFLSCDIPLIVPELLQELILQSGENAWTLPIIDNQWHPLSSIINRSILSDLEEHLNKKKLKLMRFIESIDYKLLNCDERFPWFHPHILDNMNDKLTLKGIEERLK